MRALTRLPWLRSLLLCTMLLGTLLPTVSRALVAQGLIDSWQMVCSAQGMRWVQTGGESRAPASTPAATADCPLCMVGARDLPLPPTPPALAAAQRLVQHAPTLGAMPDAIAPIVGIYSNTPPLRAPPLA